MENQTAAPKVPIFIPILRGAQVAISIIILGLAAAIIHGKYFDQLGFAIVCVIFTWFVTAYCLGTVYVASLRNLNNPLIEMGSNLFMCVFWLACMGANAALRLTFRYWVTIAGCYDNGNTIDSTTCYYYKTKRSENAPMGKRDGAIATQAGLSEMSAVAGLSALELLLFIATLILTFITWNQSRRKTGGNTYAPQKQNEGFQMAAATPQQPQQPYVQPQAYVQQPYDGQQPYAQQPYAVPAAKEGTTEIGGNTAYQSPVATNV